MGLNQANSNYACLYCHVHKDNRYNTSMLHFILVHAHVPLYSFPMFRWMVDRTFPRRTQQSINSCLKSRDKKGCKFSPLIKIPIDNIVIDELHLMLRITDVLLRNLVWAMEKLDQNERQQGKQRSASNNHLDQLVNTIRSCGITFRVYT